MYGGGREGWRILLTGNCQDHTHQRWIRHARVDAESSFATRDRGDGRAAARGCAGADRQGVGGGTGQFPQGLCQTAPGGRGRGRAPGGGAQQLPAQALGADQDRRGRDPSDQGARSRRRWCLLHSNLLPPYLTRARSVEELIPWLYLMGVSTGGAVRQGWSTRPRLWRRTAPDPISYFAARAQAAAVALVSKVLVCRG